MVLRPAALLVGCLALASCGDSAERPSYLDCLDEGRAPTDSEVHALVDALVENYGGAERWRDLQFLVLEDVYLRSSNDIMSNHAVRETFCRPDDCFRAVLDQRGETQQRLLSHGESHLEMTGGDLKPTKGDHHVAVWWEYKSYRIPDRLSRESTRLEAAAPVEVDGNWTIPVTAHDGREPDVTYFVDPSGPVVRRMEGLLPNSALAGGGVMRRLAKVFSEFARHDGVLVPERTHAYDRDERRDEFRRVALIEVREFRVATRLGDEFFAPDRPAPRIPR